MDKHYLTPLLSPDAIVVFSGDRAARPKEADRPASDAEALHAALTAQRFEGTLQFLDIGTSGTLADLAQARADLAVIALPPSEGAAALEIAGRMACRTALVLGSGFSAEQAAELGRIARRENMHLLGPNTLGFQRPGLQLNASLLGPLARAGALALVSQSGALTAAMLDWAASNTIGFSTVVTIGQGADIDVAQVLDFLANDRATDSIIVYLEAITNARRFMSALRAAANAKPVVVLKAGRQPAGNQAARTHSGAIVGSDEVFDAALRRAGAVRARSFVELFSAAKCLASRYRPVGQRLAIITNGGGPGVLAADWVNEIGLELGVLTAESRAVLQPQLSPLATLTDLIDLSEAASAEDYRRAVDMARRDGQIDGVLALHSPKRGVDPSDVARVLVEARPGMGKPLLACWMGDVSVVAGRQLLSAGSIPNFRTPEAAVGAFGNIASFYQNQRLLQQTPPPLSTLAEPDIEAARLIIESVLAERRKVLTEMESKTLLSAFHIPVTRTIVARSPNEAMMIATQLGFPVALKIDSPDISHKSDVEGVALNIMNGAGVRDTYQDLVDRVRRAMPEARINGVAVQRMARARRGREVYIGLVTDPAFGPVIAFGAGGTMIELLNDRAMELPPLNQFLARHLIERARIAVTLGEWRGAPPVNFEALEQVLLRVSEMACELPQLREMDINPLIIDEDGAVAVDARIVIDHGSATSRHLQHYHHLAILPYPARYEQVWPMRGGGECIVRPVHPDDAEMLQELVQGLSQESRYLRYASAMTELPHSMLARFTLIDYDREMALVAVIREKASEADGSGPDRDRIIAVSRYITNPDQTSCEFGLLVGDAWQGRGLGARLLESIMEVARERGLQEIDGLVLRNNPDMLALMRSLGFEVKPYREDPDFMLVTRMLQ